MKMVKEHPLKCLALVAVLVFVLMMLSSYLYGKSSLDNRPRWMMGGLRDDTGSHNANDVYGLGFGLDQTRKGVATVDNQY